MLAIQVGSHFLDLSADTSVSLNWLSPLFDRESFERFYTYPFKLPATPKNKRIFEFAHRLDSRVTRKRYNALLYIDGVQFQSGIIEVTEPSRFEYEIVFKSMSLYLAERLKKIKLTEQLDYEIYVTDDYCPDVLYEFLYDPDEIDVTYTAFKVNDTVFDVTLGNGPDIQPLIDAINAVFPGLAENGDTLLPSRPAPLVALGLLIKQPGCNDYTLDSRPANSELEHPENEYLLGGLYGDVSAAEEERIRADWHDHMIATVSGSSTHRFPVIKAPNLYGEKNSAFAGYINYFIPLDIGETLFVYQLNVLSDVNLIWTYTIMPLFTVEAVLAQIAALLDDVSGFAGDWLEDAEILDLLVWNNRPLDRILEDFEGNKVNVPPGSFNIRDHVPDMTAQEFLLALSSTFCLYYRERAGRVEIAPCKNLLRLPIQDWTDKAEPDYKQVIPENNGYTLDYDRQDDETELPFQLQRIDGGVEAQEFVTQFYTLHYLQEFDELASAYISDVRSWIVPLIYEEGTSTVYGTSNAASARLIFWRGMQVSQLYDPDDLNTVTDNKDYPFASHNVRDRDNIPIGNYALDWNGGGVTDFGLFENWWKDYIRLVTEGKEVSRAMRLTVADLFNIRNLEVTRLRIYSEDGEMVAVIKSVSVKASVRFGLEVAKVEMIREPY